MRIERWQAIGCTKLDAWDQNYDYDPFEDSDVWWRASFEFLTDRQEKARWEIVRLYSREYRPAQLLPNDEFERRALFCLKDLSRTIPFGEDQ